MMKMMMLRWVSRRGRRRRRTGRRLDGLMQSLPKGLRGLLMISNLTMTMTAVSAPHLVGLTNHVVNKCEVI